MWPINAIHRSVSDLFSGTRWIFEQKSIVWNKMWSLVILLSRAQWTFFKGTKFQTNFLFVIKVKLSCRHGSIPWKGWTLLRKCDMQSIAPISPINSEQNVCSTPGHLINESVEARMSIEWWSSRRTVALDSLCLRRSCLIVKPFRRKSRRTWKCDDKVVEMAWPELTEQGDKSYFSRGGRCWWIPLRGSQPLPKGQHWDCCLDFVLAVEVFFVCRPLSLP